MKWQSKHDMQTILLTNVDNIHLKTGPEGNGHFCFPESPDVAREESTRSGGKHQDSRGKQNYQNCLVSRGACMRFVFCYISRLG